MTTAKDRLAHFPFYAGDFADATETWPNARVGAYMRLLTYQWNKHAIPADDIDALARIIREPRAEARRLWSGELQAKFQKTDAGWQNLRLEQVRRDVILAIDRAKKHGEAGAKGRWNARAMPGHIPGHVREQSRSNAQIDARGGARAMLSTNTKDERKDPDPSVPLRDQSVREFPQSPTNGSTRSHAQAPGALAGTLPRDHMNCGFCGTRFCVKARVFVDMVRGYGAGPDAETVTSGWLRETDQHFGPDESYPGPLWLLDRWQAFLKASGRVPCMVRAEGDASLDRAVQEIERRKAAK